MNMANGNSFGNILMALRQARAQRPDAGMAPAMPQKMRLTPRDGASPAAPGMPVGSSGGSGQLGLRSLLRRLMAMRAANQGMQMGQPGSIGPLAAMAGANAMGQPPYVAQMNEMARRQRFDPSQMRY